MRPITAVPVLQELMSLDPPWEVDGEVETSSSRPRSAQTARGSLFTVTPHFLLSIVSWTSHGKRGRNRDNLIVLRIPKRSRADIICPKPLLFGLLLLQGEAVQEPPVLHKRLQRFQHHLPTSPRWEEQRGPALAWLWRQDVNSWGQGISSIPGGF